MPNFFFQRYVNGERMADDVLITKQPTLEAAIPEALMIDWAPEAIEAAHRAMFQEPYDGTTAAMIGAGLDAAAAAQGIKDEEITRLREELAAAQSRITDLIKISATLNVRTSKLNALREENARLRELLKPFQEAAGKLDDEPVGVGRQVGFTIKDCRAIRTAIREKRSFATEGGKG